MSGSPAEPLATQALWTEFSGRLRSWFARRAPAGDVDELVQECFLRIHQHLPQLRGAERVGPWVQSIARSVLVDHLRGPRAAPAQQVEPAAEEDDPRELTLEVAGWLPGFLARLPAADREVLELVDLAGLAQTELAARLSISTSAAKSRVQRARAKLRELLSACCRVDFDRAGHVVDWRRRAGECACD